LISIIVVLALISLASSKVVRKTWTIRNFESEQKWNYLTKFILDIGRGYVTVRARLLNVPQKARDEIGFADTYVNFNTVYDD